MREPLSFLWTQQDVEYFKKFTVHPEFETLVWPNGADFAPSSCTTRCG